MKDIKKKCINVVLYLVKSIDYRKVFSEYMECIDYYKLKKI